ncbi:hypothetical protein GIB67_006909, partial [Kingdonia uniflora]
VVSFLKVLYHVHFDFQVYAEFEVYGGSLNLTGCYLYGGAPYHSQETSLKRGVDIAIGTPGRIKFIKVSCSRRG